MQFLESSVIGLRSAFYELESPNKKIKFLIFPMVHIADPLFYEEVSKGLKKCDNLIFEGVKSNKSWFLVQSYKIIAKKKSLGIVEQGKALPIKEQKLNLIHGDIDTKDFNNAWKTIPLYFRLFIMIFAPIYGWMKYFTVTRDSLSQIGNVESFDDFEDIDEDSAVEKLNQVILYKRDEVLIDVLRKHIKLNSNENTTTAIVYGARHMPAVVSELIKNHGFKVTKSEWVQVI